jgi:hypothetical protein
LFLQILASDAAGADKLFTTLGAGSDVLKKLNRELVKRGLKESTGMTETSQG